MNGVGRFIRWLVMWLWAVSACAHGDASDELLGKTQARLVGAEFPIGAPAHSQGYESVEIPRVACESTGRCLAVYVQSGGDGSYLVARRMDQSGPLDTDVLLLSKISGNPNAIEVAAGDGGEYLISWATNAKLYAARFDAGAGAWLDATPLDLSALASAYSLQAVASTAAGYVVIYNDHVKSKLSALRIVGGVLQETSGIPLGGISSARAHGTGSQVAVVTAFGLVRFDVAQGIALDATPIVFDKYAPMVGMPAITFDGTNYVVVWSNYEEVLAARIKASDGVLLDPPDDFNELPGGKRIAYSRSLSPEAWFDGTNLIALWIDNVGQDYDLVGARVTTELSRVQGTANSSYEFALADTADAQAFRASFGTGFGLALWNNTEGIVGVRIQTVASNAPTATAQSISFAGTTHEALGVASNGADFLVAYRAYDERQIFVRAIDGVTGAPLAPQQTLTAFQDNILSGADRVSIAWSGVFYVATWRQQGSSYFKLIHCDGTPHASDRVLLGAGDDAEVACNDDRCAITWRYGSGIYAKRLDAKTGVVLDSEPLLIGTGDSYHGGDIASDSAPAPSMRTFLIVWTTSTGVMARRLRSQGSLVGETIIHSVANPFQPNVVSDGTQFFATWQVNRELFGRLIDATSGAPKGANPTSYAPPAPNYDITTALTYDGSSFFAVFGDTAGSSTRGTRIDASGVQLDVGGIPITGLESGFAVGAAPWGRSLIAYFGYHQPSFSTVVVGRFHDNALGSGTSGRSFVCPAGEGTGGAGGEAGSGSQSNAGETNGAGGSESNPGGGAAGNDAGGDAGEVPASGGVSGEAGASDGVPQAGATPAGGGGGTGGTSAGSSAAGSPSTAGSPNGGSAGSGSGNASGGSRAGTSSDGASRGESGGCGCRVVSGGSRPVSGLLLGITLAAFGLRRRRFGRGASSSPKRLSKNHRAASQSLLADDEGASNSQEHPLV